MTITRRLVKGSAITAAEHDATMDHIENSIPVSVKNYGAVGDGVTDDTAAFTSWASALSAGGIGLIPPGTYLLSSQITITAPTADRVVIFGWGAEITTSGSISGLKITEGSTNGGVHVHGLQINHRGNANATYGFDLVGATNCRLYDCYVRAHGVQANYAAYHLSNTTPSDNGTGCFWTYLIGCGEGKDSGSDVGDIPYGILIEGASNAVNILGGQYGRETTTCIKIQNHTGETYVSNGLLIQGVAFENYTTAIHVSGAATSPVGGHRFIGNRFETGTTIFSYTGITSQPATPPFMMGNYFSSDAGTYFNNPNSLYATIFETNNVPDTGVSRFVNQRGLEIQNLDATYDGLKIRTPNLGSGIALKDTNDSVLYGFWRPGNNSGGAGTILGGTFTSSYRPINFVAVSGISLNDVQANNLRGTVTFAGAATAAVTFAVAETDATYFVALGGSANETFWITSKATTGFTINSSNAASTATVNWILIR